MLHTDDEFLREIERQPAERTVRLVYADWLDERDDVRGELIRVEEEMRQVPVYSDRFWELKPRRNELRAQIGPEWCGRMRYGTECEPVFRHGIPDGWRERWRLIREFTERWHGIPMPDIGGRQKEIAAEEAKLGRTLPPSVREWIAYAFDVRQRTDYHTIFGYVLALEDVPGQAALSLLSTDEGLYRWGVPHTEFAQSDPNVLGYYYLRVHGQLPIFPPDEQLVYVRPMTEFTLWHVMQSRSGHREYYASIPETDHPIREVTVTLPVHARCGELDLHEMDNLLMIFGPENYGRGLDMWVKIAPSLTPKELPVSLRDFMKHGPGVEDPVPF